MNLQKFVVAFVGTLVGAAPFSAFAVLPSSSIHNTRYIESSGSYTYYTSGSETYVRETLPNEWRQSWSADTLQAGSVIIRSGVLWRISRSVAGSSWPNNNCYQGTTSWGFKYYRTAPNSRGGEEQWVPFSAVAAVTTQSDATRSFHAERVMPPSGRPDPFVALRYNSTIQNRTNSGTGGWLTKVRYAYTGSGAPGTPYNPNTECSQVDSQTSTDPTFISN